MCYDSGRGSADKEAGIVRKFHLLSFLLTENIHGVGIVLADIFSQRTGFDSAIRKIIPVFLSLQTEQEKGKPLACDKGDHGAE